MCGHSRRAGSVRSPIRGRERQRKLLDRIVALLTRLGQRGYSVREVPDRYDGDEVESDIDGDTDPVSDIEQVR